MPKSSKPSRSATKQAATDSTRLRYCAQPIQHPRQFDPSVDAQRARAIINNGKKWVNGTQLTYYCYQAGDGVPAARRGKPTDIEEVRKAFKVWFDLGVGINFKEVARAEDALIRIGFDSTKGSWSYVGRDVLNVRDPLQSTMNFGWPLDTPYGRDTAMHEIGHTLGLEHEHQNLTRALPAAPMPCSVISKGRPTTGTRKRSSGTSCERYRPQKSKARAGTPIP